MRRRLTVVTSALGALTLTVAPAFADVRTVNVGGAGTFYFEDSTRGDGKVVADVGDQLTFAFSGNVQHSATVAGQFDSGVKKPGTTFTTGALMKAGTFTLYCSVHSRHSTKLVVSGTTTTPTPTNPTPTPAPTPAPTSGGSTSDGGPATPGGSSPGSATGNTNSGGSMTGGTTSGGTTSGDTMAGGSRTPTPTATGAQTSSGTARGTAAATSSPTPSLAPVGDGVVDPDELAQDPGAATSLSEAIGRNPAAQGTWTRSVRQALLALIPMLALSVWALRRRPDRT